MARATLNRDILRLAVPALGALVAEPLFLIVDSMSRTAIPTFSSLIAVRRMLLSGTHAGSAR